MRKLLNIIGWSLLGLFLALVLLRIVTGFIMQRRYDAALAQLRSLGQPLTLAELAPPPLPDDRNAALLYLQAFQLLDASPESSFRDLDQLFSSPEPLTPAQLDRASSLLAPLSTPLHLLRRAASLPDSRFPIDYSRPAYTLRRPHLSDFPTAAKLLVLSSQRNLASRRPDSALDDCSAALRLADSVRSEPFLISLGYRTHVHRLALRQANLVLARSEPSPRALRSFLVALGDTQDRSQFILAIKGERCFGLSLCNDFFDNRISRPDLRDMGISSPTLARIGVFILRPLLLADAASYIAILSSFEECSHQPWHLCSVRWQSLSRSWLSGIGKYPPTHPLLALTLPAIPRAGASFDWDIALRSGAAQAAALRLYRLRFGRYPDSLSDLAPDFLPSLPPDPFSGNNFIYHRKSSGFILYSLGPNLSDEGGLTNGANHEQGDFVWTSSH